jgi:hypothetical protein
MRLHDDAEYIEKERRMRAGEIPCDFCNVRLTIPICPRCGNPQASIRPKKRKATGAAPQ